MNDANVRNDVAYACEMENADVRRLSRITLHLFGKSGVVIWVRQMLFLEYIGWI